MKAIFIDIPGPSDYEKVWSLQNKLHKMRVSGEINDILILTEHEHVYTIGKAGNEKDLRVSEFFLKDLGAKIFKIDRGGKITYHGPGQIVGYPIFNLNELKIDVHTYLRKIEEVIILTLDDFGIKAERKDGLTGVWVGDEKVASIGIKVSHWVTMHGFALNVNTDLKFFDFIFPCGLKDVSMTSMKKILGFDVDIADVKVNLKKKFEAVFDIEFIGQFEEILNEEF